jgi:hypothetical protein
LISSAALLRASRVSFFQSILERILPHARKFGSVACGFSCLWSCLIQYSGE